MNIELIIDGQPTMILFNVKKDSYTIKESFPYLLPMTAIVVLAKQIKERFQIHGYGNILMGAPGDWIVKMGGEICLSKKKAFEESYEVMI